MGQWARRREREINIESEMKERDRRACKIIIKYRQGFEELQNTFLMHIE